MWSRISERLVWLGVWLLLSTPVGGAWGQGSGETKSGAAHPPLVAEATRHYIEGLEALEAADFQHAVASLTQAIAMDEDNADYYRARGVAHTLAEDFPAALADLQRADRLRQGRDQEARLWLAAAYRMSGKPQEGARYFTHGREVPVEYASLVYNDMAMQYWRTRHLENQAQKQAPEVAETQPQAPDKTLFPEVAAAYARRHKATGAAPAQAVMARMKVHFEQGDCAGALNDLVLLRQSSPDDPTLRGYWVSCLLTLGNAIKAREEFTRALCYLPFWAEGYMGRAQGAAILGDERRARADLEVAAALLSQRHRGLATPEAQAAAARLLDEVTAQVTHHLAQKPPEDAVRRFFQHVEKEAEWPALVDAAHAVHRWTNARRLRYDEAYQDRIRVISEAIQDDRTNADWSELLARFLYNHHVVPVVWNGPRRDGEQLRPQSQAERHQELARAMDLADRALQLHERHANAMATKGWMLYLLHRRAEAEAQANRGLTVEPQNVWLLRLKAQLLLDQSEGLEAQAIQLRRGRYETYTEKRSGGKYEVQKYYPPSPDQLAQAAALTAQAVALHQQAQQRSSEAKRVESEVIPALLKNGDTALAAGDGQGARRAFEQAYAYDPDLGDLLPRLAEVYKRLGDQRRHVIFALLAEPMRHTTAAEPLQAAWEQAVRTAWKSATERLDSAAAIDPADARVPAYRSIIAASRAQAKGVGDAGEAQRQRRAALALEEARARLMGSSFLSDSGGPLALEEVGLTLIVRLQAGNALLASAEHDRALEAFVGNLRLEPRLGKEALVQLVPSAMLPDPTSDVTTVPEAPSLASLMAWSRLGTGRVLLALGRPAEAEQAYRAVRAYLANWPSTAKGQETTYVVDAWTRLGLAEAAYARQEYDSAFRLLTYTGWPGNLPEELVQRHKALEEQAVAARRRSLEQARQAEQRLREQEQQLTPKQRRIRSLERDIVRLEKRRDETLATMQNLPPIVSEQEKKRVAMLELDIAARKEALAREQETPDESLPLRPPRPTR